MDSFGAQRLWQLWHDHDPETPGPSTVAFRTEIERLLDSQVLDDTLEAIQPLVTSQEEYDSYGALRRVALAHTCMLMLSSRKDPAVRYTALGVAFSMVGAEDQLAFEPSFEPDLMAYLTERARAAHPDQPKGMDFYLVPRPLHLETCGQLKLDTWRELLMEQVMHRPGAAWQRAEAVEQQVEQQIQPIASPFVQEMGERVAVLLVVVRDDEWSLADVDQWMNALCQDEAWKTRFTTPDRAVLPLTSLRDAVAAGVGHRLTTAMAISLQDREMALGEEINLEFHLHDDPESDGTTLWSSTLNGTVMDPVPFSSNILSMVGHEGMQQIYQSLGNELGRQAQRTLAQVQAASETFPLVHPTPARRRLH